MPEIIMIYLLVHIAHPWETHTATQIQWDTKRHRYRETQIQRDTQRGTQTQIQRDTHRHRYRETHRNTYRYRDTGYTHYMTPFARERNCLRSQLALTLANACTSCVVTFREFYGPGPAEGTGQPAELYVKLLHRPFHHRWTVHRDIPTEQSLGRLVYVFLMGLCLPWASSMGAGRRGTVPLTDSLIQDSVFPTTLLCSYTNNVTAQTAQPLILPVVMTFKRYAVWVM